MDWATILANPNTGIGVFLIIFVIAVLSGRLYSKKQHEEILAVHAEEQKKTEENNALLRALLEQKNER